MKLKVDIDMIQISYQSLTKSINEKMILGNTLTAGVSEVVFYATIEWVWIMMTIITICLVLITIALIFGSEAAGDLLGCLFSLIFWGFVIAAVGFIVILLIAS